MKLTQIHKMNDYNNLIIYTHVHVTLFQKYQILPQGSTCLLGEHFLDISVYLAQEVNVGGALPLPCSLVLLQ